MAINVDGNRLGRDNVKALTQALREMLTLRRRFGILID
jgi:hypothetical protein